MNKKKILFALILGIFFLSFVSSAPPITTTQTFENSYIIGNAPQTYLTQNENYTINFFVYNSSDGKHLTYPSVNCTFYLQDNKGEILFSGNVNYHAGEYYYLKLLDGNFSTTQELSYGIKCRGDAIEGATIGTWFVTPNGEEVTTGKSIFYIGLLFTLLFFFAVSIYFFSDADNILSRVGSLGAGYLLLIAITFVSWNMASDFFTSATFLVSMMEILFYVFIIGLFPLIIGLFIWYFLQLWQLKEIQRLMDKGFSFEDAKRRTGRKYK